LFAKLSLTPSKSAYILLEIPVNETPDTNLMTTIVSIISFAANIFQIAAAAIALYLFFFKRDAIKSVFSTLLNYAFQTTLVELRMNFERLNDLNASDSSQKEMVTNIFAEMVGQINGNSTLSVNCHELCVKLQSFIDNPNTLTEPRKRSLVSELREMVRSIDIQNYKR